MPNGKKEMLLGEDAYPQKQKKRREAHYREEAQSLPIG